MSRIQTTLSGFPDAFPAAFPAKVEDREALALNVAFTSESATAGALRYASGMAAGLGARLRVIVAQVVPYGRDLNDPDVNPQFTAIKAVEAARAAGVDADVNVVLCRDRIEGLHNALGPEGLLVLGGGGRSWWRFLEGQSQRRLARQLIDRGHKVLFVEGEKSL